MFNSNSMIDDVNLKNNKVNNNDYSLGLKFGKFMLINFGKLIAVIAKFIWNIKVTFVWLAAIAFFYFTKPAESFPTWSVVIIVIMVVLLLWKASDTSYWNPIDHILPFVSDNKVSKVKKVNRDLSVTRLNMLFATKLIDKKAYLELDNAARRSIESNFSYISIEIDANDGSLILNVERVFDYIENDIAKFVTYDVCNVMGGRFPQVIYTSDSSFLVKYNENISSEFLEARTLMSNAGVITADNPRIYNAVVKHLSDRDVFLIAENVGSMIPQKVVEKIVSSGVKTTQDSIFTSSRPANKNNSSDVAIIDSMVSDGIADAKLIEGNIADMASVVEFITSIAKPIADANRLLTEMGLINGKKIVKVQYGSSEEEDVFVFLENLPGATEDSLVNFFDARRGEFKARAVRSGRNSNGKLVIRLIKLNKLDKPKIVDYKDSKPVVNHKDMSVVCSVDEFGTNHSVSFKNTSGVVVGGMPGSGKTGGTTSFLMPLAMDPGVDFNVIDCKGGADWESYENISNVYSVGHAKLEEMVEFLKEAINDMNKRVRMLKKLTGQSNFWNTPYEKRLELGLKFRLFVIDECQNFFNFDKADKERAALQQQILALCEHIVKEGRSAGYCAIFITQKPTDKSLPTDIRDNCGFSIAFRVRTNYAVEAILGQGANSELGTSSPLRIPPKRVGGAVIMDEYGNYREVRFYFTPEEIQDKLLNNSPKTKTIKTRFIDLRNPLAPEDLDDYDEDDE